MKPAVVRFYIDADIRGVGRVLSELRSDVTYPGDPGGVVHKRLRSPCPVTSPRIADAVWIPEVAARGWLIITRDSKIQQHSAELASVRGHGAKLVALAGKEATSKFLQLEVIMVQWRKLEQLIDVPGPFIYTATRTSLNKVELE